MRFRSLPFRMLGLAGVAAAALAISPLQADDGEDWQDYNYPQKRFTIRFPEAPAVTATTYPAVVKDGSTVPVPTTVYTTAQGATHYRVSVARLAGTPAEDPRALQYAVDALRRTGRVALETRVSIANSPCGYYLGLNEPDGALSFLALFYHEDTGNFYDIRARVPEAEQELRMASAVHFQQSVSFLPDPAADPEGKPVEVTYPPQWQEYDFLKKSGFAIRFPAAPVVEEGTYRTAAGVEVPATRYWVREGGVLYKVTAATYWETEADTVDASEAIDPAVDLLTEAKTVTADFSTGLRNGQCGRDLTLQGRDGSSTGLTVFFPSAQHRLFIVETHRAGSATQADGGDDAALFRKSLRLAAPEE